MLSEEFSGLAQRCEADNAIWARPRNALLRLFDTDHRHGLGARRVWLRSVSPFAASLIASEQGSEQAAVGLMPSPKKFGAPSAIRIT